MNKIEVFRGQIRLNEHKTYFGLDYELTDEIGNMIDNLNKLEKEKKELIDYLKEQIKHLDNLINKGNPKPYGEELNLYENSKLRYLEILSKIENK